MPPRTYRITTFSGADLPHAVWYEQGTQFSDVAEVRYVASFKSKTDAETFLELCEGGWDFKTIIELGIREAQERNRVEEE